MAIHKVPVDEFTTPCPITVDRKTPLNEVVTCMKDGNIRHVPVVDDGKAVGIISDRDVKVVANIGGIDQLTAEEVMTPHPFSALSGSSLEEVAFAMSSEKIGSAIINDSAGKLVGVFTSTDALNALIEVLRGDLDDE